MYNVYDKFTNRDDYVTALIMSQNCPCTSAENVMGEEEYSCLNGREVFEHVKPGLMASMVLESACYSCKLFYDSVAQRIGTGVPILEAHFPLLQTDETDDEL